MAGKPSSSSALRRVGVILFWFARLTGREVDVLSGAPSHVVVFVSVYHQCRPMIRRKKECIASAASSNGYLFAKLMTS